MADISEEDELGSNFAQDNVRVTRTANARRATSTSRDDTRVAGPSKQPNSEHGRRKAQSSILETIEDVDDVQTVLEHENGNDDDDIVEVLPQPGPTKGKGRTHNTSKPPSKNQTNSRKQGPPSKRAKSVDTDFEESEAAILRDRARLNDIRVATAKKQNSEEKKLRAQLDHLQKQLKLVSDQKDDLNNQLEEVFRVRNTEPEQALEQEIAQYEERLNTQQKLIDELTSQLDRVNSLTRAGKTSTLQFLTREAADEEQRGIERKVQSLEQILAEKDRIITIRDDKISEQEQIIITLRSDLKIEIENTKAITSRSYARDPSSSAISNHGGSVVHADVFKTGKVTRLYEDLTNIMVLNMKYKESGEFGDEETLFICMFTHEASQRSLNFSLRTYKAFFDPSNPEPQNRQFMAIYTPLELDKEPDKDFVAMLDYLAEPFTFYAGQMTEFLKTLNEMMSNAIQKEDHDMEQSDV